MAREGVYTLLTLCYWSKNLAKFWSEPQLNRHQNPLRVFFLGVMCSYKQA